MPESKGDASPSQGVFSALISELRRRRVFQVAGLYLISGSTVIQGAGAMLDNLDAPPLFAKWLTWLVIAGFPVAVAVSWAYDLRVQREQHAAGGEPAWAGARGRALFAVGVVVGMALLGVVAWGAVSHPVDEPVAPTARHATPVLAVYPIEAQGGAVERSPVSFLQSALAEALDESPGVELRSPELVNSYGAKQVTLDTLAALLDLDYLVVARLAVSDTATRLTVRVLDPRGTLMSTPGTFSAGPAAIESAEELTRKAADYVLRTVGAELREQSWSFGTRSLAALYALKDARALITGALTMPGPSAALLEEADTLLARAVAADPDWAEPAEQRALLAAQRAVAQRGKDAAKVRSALDQGIAITDGLLRRNPDSAEALAARGMLLYYQVVLQLPLDSAAHTAALVQAQAHLQRALEIDRTHAGAAGQLADLLYRRADFAGARHWAARALALDAYQERAEILTYQLAMATFETGDDTAALRLCRESLRRFEDSPVHHGCVLEVLAFGDSAADVADAWQQLEHISRLATDQPGTVPYYQAQVAAVLARAGLRDSAEHVLAQALHAYAPKPVDIFWLEAAVRFRLAQEDSATTLLRAWVASQPATLHFNLSRRALRSYQDRLYTDLPRL